MTKYYVKIRPGIKGRWSLTIETPMVIKRFDKCTTVVFIQGPQGLGKTTIARSICEKVPDSIFIEQSLMAFRPGFSSAKTILTLAKFNGILSYVCQQDFGVEPQYIGASTARKSCGIKIPKGEKAKDVVLQYVLDNEPNFVVEYTKFGNPRPKYFDMADSIIIAKAGFHLCQQSK